MSDLGVGVGGGEEEGALAGHQVPDEPEDVTGLQMLGGVSAQDQVEGPGHFITERRRYVGRIIKSFHLKSLHCC